MSFQDVGYMLHNVQLSIELDMKNLTRIFRYYNLLYNIIYNII